MGGDLLWFGICIDAISTQLLGFTDYSEKVYFYFLKQNSAYHQNHYTEAVGL